MDNSKKPWAQKEQMKSVRTAHQGMRSPLNKGHNMPLAKGGGAPPAPKK